MYVAFLKFFYKHGIRRSRCTLYASAAKPSNFLCFPECLVPNNFILSGLLTAPPYSKTQLSWLFTLVTSEMLLRDDCKHSFSFSSCGCGCLRGWRAPFLRGFEDLSRRNNLEAHTSRQDGGSQWPLFRSRIWDKWLQGFSLFCRQNLYLSSHRSVMHTTPSIAFVVMCVCLCMCICMCMPAKPILELPFSDANYTHNCICCHVHFMCMSAKLILEKPPLSDANYTYNTHFWSCAFACACVDYLAKS